MPFAYLSWEGRITLPDFIYRWGARGRRYFLDGGIDTEYLTRPWNRFAPPGDPHLLSELYALTAEIGGRFHEPQILLWSSVFFLAVLIAAREALGGPDHSGPGLAQYLRHLVLAILAFLLAAFAIGDRMAGAADWVLGLVLLAALPVMAAGRDRRADFQIGILAAVASTAKIEGMVLGALLIAAQAARRGLRGRGNGASLAWLVAPFLLSLGLWGALVSAHDLPLPVAGLSTLDPARLPILLHGLADPATLGAWHGAALARRSVAAAAGEPLSAAPGSGLRRAARLLCPGLPGRPGGHRLLRPLQRPPARPPPAARGARRHRPGARPVGGPPARNRDRPGADSRPPDRRPPDRRPVFDSAAPSQPFDDEFRDLLARLHLVWIWSLRTIKLRYKRSLLGIAWTLLEPLAVIAVLAVVFSALFRFETPNYPIYVLSGWVLWNFFSKSTTAIVREVRDGWRLAASVRLSRSVFLVASVLTHLVHWLLALLLVIAVMVVLGHLLSWALLSLPLAMAVAAVFALGVGLIVSTVPSKAFRPGRCRYRPSSPGTTI